jgi:hypothetical protein
VSILLEDEPGETPVSDGISTAQHAKRGSGILRTRLGRKAGEVGIDDERSVRDSLIKPMPLLYLG